MILKYTIAWLPMVFIAIMNGAIRGLSYGKYLSELRAHQVSSLSIILPPKINFLVFLVKLTRIPWRRINLTETLSQKSLEGIVDSSGEDGIFWSEYCMNCSEVTSRLELNQRAHCPSAVGGLQGTSIVLFVDAQVIQTEI